MLMKGDATPNGAKAIGRSKVKISEETRLIRFPVFVSVKPRIESLETLSYMAEVSSLRISSAMK